MPLYIGDYRADTAHLSATEHGIYMLLIMHYWQTGSLPTEDRQLARVACATDAEWRRARPMIVKFFLDGWKHKRIEFELSEAARLSAAGRAGGLASGEARRVRKVNDPPNDLGTVVQRTGNGLPTNGEALPSQLPSQAKINSSFLVCEANAKKGSPRHLATSENPPRVYVQSGTPEWEAYAADYRATRGAEPHVNRHGGKWFKTVGEAST